MKKIMMVIAAGMMSFGLIGCGDSDSCFNVADCSGSSGYACDDSGRTCWSTKQQCQDSSVCN